MTMTDKEHTVEVAIRTADSLLEWDRILTEFADIDSGSPQELLATINDEDEDEERRDLARRALAIMDDEGRWSLDWWHDIGHALDVEVTGRLVDGRWELSGVALLVGWGGPTVRLVAVDEFTIRVEVSWWGDSAERTIDVGLAGVMWQHAEEVAP